MPIKNFIPCYEISITSNYIIAPNVFNFPYNTPFNSTIHKAPYLLTLSKKFLSSLLIKSLTLRSLSRPLMASKTALSNVILVLTLLSVFFLSCISIKPPYFNKSLILKTIWPFITHLKYLYK